MGGGQDNKDGGTGTMTADSSCPPAASQGGDDLRGGAGPHPMCCGGPTTMIATKAREAR